MIMIIGLVQLRHHSHSATGRQKGTFVFEAKFHDKELPYGEFVSIYFLHSTSAARWDLKPPDLGALLLGNIFRLYSSKWTKKLVSIRPTTTVFNLRFFPNFLKLFVFLCQLADYIHNQVREMSDELEKDKAGFKKRIRDAVREPWRPWKHSGPKSGAESWQGGSVEGVMDDSAGERMGEDLNDEDVGIRDGDQDLSYPPLKDVYVRSLQGPPKDVLSWANQTIEASTVAV